jgi:hypothetical protein
MACPVPFTRNAWEFRSQPPRSVVDTPQRKSAGHRSTDRTVTTHARHGGPGFSPRREGVLIWFGEHLGEHLRPPAAARRARRKLGVHAERERPEARYRVHARGPCPHFANTAVFHDGSREAYARADWPAIPPNCTPCPAIQGAMRPRAPVRRRRTRLSCYSSVMAVSAFELLVRARRGGRFRRAGPLHRRRVRTARSVQPASYHLSYHMAERP